MRALKALVAIMGVMLVLGTATLIVAMLKRSPARSGKPLANMAIAELPAETSVAVPAGSTVGSISAYGTLLSLRVSGPQGDAIWLVDPHDGTVVERIHLTGAAISEQK